MKKYLIFVQVVGVCFDPNKINSYRSSILKTIHERTGLQCSLSFALKISNILLEHEDFRSLSRWLKLNLNANTTTGKTLINYIDENVIFE